MSLSSHLDTSSRGTLNWTQLGQTLGSNSQVLQVKLRRLAEATVLLQSFERHAQDGFIMRALHPRNCLYYVEQTRYDETPMKARISGDNIQDLLPANVVLDERRPTAAEKLVEHLAAA
eukprot:6954347-Pyramimonas_sp.AAC.1